MRKPGRQSIASKKPVQEERPSIYEKKNEEAVEDRLGSLLGEGSEAPFDAGDDDLLDADGDLAEQLELLAAANQFSWENHAKLFNEADDVL